MKKRESEIFNNLVDYLKRHSTFEKVDEFVLIELSAYWQIFFDAKEMVENEGAVQTFQNKTSNVSGWFTAMNQASKNIQALSHKLGIYEIIKHKLHNYGKLTKDTEGLLK